MHVNLITIRDMVQMMVQLNNKNNIFVISIIINYTLNLPRIKGKSTSSHHSTHLVSKYELFTSFAQ